MTKIFVAGHNGMVGSAICRQLQKQDVELVTASRQELDLTNQIQVKDFFSTHKFDQVYLAAAKVGGIHAVLAGWGISRLLALLVLCVVMMDC